MLYYLFIFSSEVLVGHAPNICTELINYMYQELMSAAKRCKGASNFSIFCKPSVVESHLCKLPYMENLCKLHK